MQETDFSEIKLMTIKEVAERLDVSVALVYRLVAQRELEHVRVGIRKGSGRIVIPVSEVERYVKERKA